jgi:hypothetical protein
MGIPAKCTPVTRSKDMYTGAIKLFTSVRLYSILRAFRHGYRSVFFIIYLSRVLCLSVCVSRFVAERSAILLVLVIKLTKETRRRGWRGRDRDGEIWKGTDWRGRV